MSAVRAVVLRTAGTNCDAETVHALKRAGAEVDLVHLHALMAEPQRLDAFSMIVFPGGFTYGDDIQSGTVFAVEMRDRVLPAIRKRIADGALVLGICNGFQILTRSGLLPRHGRQRRGDGESAAEPVRKFEARWVRLECVTDKSVFLERGQVIDCPVAHMGGSLHGRGRRPRGDRGERPDRAPLHGTGRR